MNNQPTPEQIIKGGIDIELQAVLSYRVLLHD